MQGLPLKRLVVSLTLCGIFSLISTTYLLYNIPLLRSEKTSITQVISKRIPLKGGEKLKDVGNSTRNTLLYVVSSSNEYQLQKVKDLAQTFGQNFVIIWDNKEKANKRCPKDFTKQARCIDQWQWADRADKGRNLVHPCCGWQKAIAWATDNRKSSDYFWFMEDDVHFTNVSLLEDLLNNTDSTYDNTADLLIHKKPDKAKGWAHARWTRKSIAKRWGSNFWKENTQVCSMMNLFRTSELFMTRLEEDFLAHRNTWQYYETYFLALSDLYKLKLSNFGKFTTHLRYRPCWTEFPTPSIYHPVKFRDGKFTECH